jgi:predicted O-linked N-acetylglucosamine transferase (SPINDLY family)
MKHYQRAVELKPDYPDALYNLGALHHALIEIPKSIEYYRKCLALKPDYRVAQSSLLLAMHYLVPFDQKAIYDESVRLWGGESPSPYPSTSRGLPRDPTGYRERGKEAGRRLRIGYVSADLFLHSVSFFIEPILEARDRSQFEVFVYSSVINPDATTRRLASYVDQWRDVAALSDERLAQMIRSDQIDILVDLSGHTSHNRMPAYALKPAPVQVTYLGYPNTTGLRAMDYRIADPVADPPGADDALYVEKLVRLPRTAWCYRPPADAPEVSELPAIRNGYVTFGSFNNLAKLNEPLIAAWCRLLEGVPGARLLIKSATLEHDSVRQRLIATFASHGIGEDRLQVLGRVVKYNEHLRWYNQVDLSLDTFPYNGTTTTCESLWMGAAVVTWAGDHHVSRVGKSLLMQVGLGEMITTSEAQYIERAVELARDTARIAELRATLRDRMRRSSLTDGAAMARDIEAAYLQMWQEALTR